MATNKEAQTAFNKINRNQELPGKHTDPHMDDVMRAYVEADIAMTNVLYNIQKANERLRRIKKAIK